MMMEHVTLVNGVAVDKSMEWDISFCLVTKMANFSIFKHSASFLQPEYLTFLDGTRYDGCFVNGLCNGLGVMTFPDGAK